MFCIQARFARDVYTSPVAGMVLYREGITKGPTKLRGGYRLPMRSMLANWRAVTARVDGAEGITLKQGVPYFLAVPPGRHTVHVEARGFAPASASVEVKHSADLIVAVTPAWLDGVSKSTPLGELRLRTGVGPEQLQPYLFYRLLPTSMGRTSVFPSVIASALASFVLLSVLGLIPLILAFYLLVVAPVVGVIVLAIALLLVPISVPAGIGGVVIATRFLRLRPEWRTPVERHSSRAS